jgi:hypothetical protein
MLVFRLWLEEEEILLATYGKPVPSGEIPYGYKPGDGCPVCEEQEIMGSIIFWVPG